MKPLILASILALNILLASDCRAQNTPLYKSTDYLPSAIKKHRKFSFKRLVKKICTLGNYSSNSLEQWNYYDYSPTYHQPYYGGYSFGMDSSPFGYNYVW